MENYKFIFHCDRNACGDRCSYPTCRMTFDPDHAVNFVKREIEANTFYEEVSSEELTTLYGGDINIGLNDDDIEKIRNGERIELYNIELDSRHTVHIVIKKEGYLWVKTFVRKTSSRLKPRIRLNSRRLFLLALTLVRL